MNTLSKGAKRVISTLIDQGSSLEDIQNVMCDGEALGNMKDMTLSICEEIDFELRNNTAPKFLSSDKKTERIFVRDHLYYKNLFDLELDLIKTGWTKISDFDFESGTKALWIRGKNALGSAFFGEKPEECLIEWIDVIV